MKIKGKDLSSLSKPKTMVIPVEGEDNIVLKYAPILNFSEYDDKYPEPQPPTVTVPGGGQSVALDDADYLKAQDSWAARKTDWMIWKSLSADENVEWETVDPNNPSTFEHVRKELQESVGDGIMNIILTKIIESSNLRSDMIDIATKDFLATGAVAPAVS